MAQPWISRLFRFQCPHQPLYGLCSYLPCLALTTSQGWSVVAECRVGMSQKYKIKTRHDWYGTDAALPAKSHRAHPSRSSPLSTVRELQPHSGSTPHHRPQRVGEILPLPFFSSARPPARQSGSINTTKPRLQDKMHSVVRPNAWTVIKLPSGNTRVILVVPNRCVPCRIPPLPDLADAG